MERVSQICVSESRAGWGHQRAKRLPQGKGMERSRLSVVESRDFNKMPKWASEEGQSGEDVLKERQQKRVSGRRKPPRAKASRNTKEVKGGWRLSSPSKD